MRNFMLATFAVAMAVAAGPSRAQTYDPSYPVCKRVNSDASSVDCYYTSMEQCKDSIRSMSAECVVNPFYASHRGVAVRVGPSRHN
jgi:hypothetical protein